MQLHDWKVDALIPYARNPRKNDHVVDDIAAAIREFGFRVPVLAKSDGTIVDGHLRWKAAKKLNLPTVPVLLADDLTETQIKAFRISVNKMSDKPEWDYDLLTLELEDLKAAEFAVELTGFNEDELLAMLGENIDPLDEMPGLPEGDKEPFQQMTFTLHDTQAEQVQAAMQAAKDIGPFVDSPNENSNGNALARICETFLTTHA